MHCRSFPQPGLAPAALDHVIPWLSSLPRPQLKCSPINQYITSIIGSSAFYCCLNLFSTQRATTRSTYTLRNKHTQVCDETFLSKCRYGPGDLTPISSPSNLSRQPCHSSFFTLTGVSAPVCMPEIPHTCSGPARHLGRPGRYPMSNHELAAPLFPPIQHTAAHYLVPQHHTRSTILDKAAFSNITSNAEITARSSLILM